MAALRLATAKVREQSRMMEAFFQQAVTSFVLLDRNYRFVRVNEAFARFYGLKPADVVAELLDDSITEALINHEVQEKEVCHQ